MSFSNSSMSYAKAAFYMAVRRDRTGLLTAEGSQPQYSLIQPSGSLWSVRINIWRRLPQALKRLQCVEPGVSELLDPWGSGWSVWWVSGRCKPHIQSGRNSQDKYVYVGVYKYL